MRAWQGSSPRYSPFQRGRQASSLSSRVCRARRLPGTSVGSSGGIADAQISHTVCARANGWHRAREGVGAQTAGVGDRVAKPTHESSPSELSLVPLVTAARHLSALCYYTLDARRRGRRAGRSLG